MEEEKSQEKDNVEMLPIQNPVLASITQLAEDLRKDNVEAFAIIWKPKVREYEWQFEGESLTLAALVGRLTHFVNIATDHQEGISELEE